VKHLVPNRALKEAIDFEATKDNTHEKIRKHPSTFKTTRHAAISTAPTVRRASDATTASSIKHATKNRHHTIINNFLSSLNVKSRIDEFGIAFLSMDKLQPKFINDDERIKLLMVIEAPPAKETFRLYTHFNGSMERHCIAPPRLSKEEEEPTTTTALGENSLSKNENRVFTNLLRDGRHKALTLTKVCEGRVRFSFEGRNSEIGCERKVRGMLDMFVKVSFRMKKRIER